MRQPVPKSYLNACPSEMFGYHAVVENPRTGALEAVCTAGEPEGCNLPAIRKAPSINRALLTKLRAIRNSSPPSLQTQALLIKAMKYEQRRLRLEI